MNLRQRRHRAKMTSIRRVNLHRVPVIALIVSEIAKSNDNGQRWSRR